MLVALAKKYDAVQLKQPSQNTIKRRKLTP